MVVTYTLHHFRREILWSSTVALCKIAAHLLGQSIINNLKIATLVHQYIFQFEVPVHNTFTVEFTDSQHNLHGIELDNFFWESLLFREDLVEFTTSNERHDEVESRLSLEQKIHSD